MIDRHNNKFIIPFVMTKPFKDIEVPEGIWRAANPSKGLFFKNIEELASVEQSSNGTIGKYLVLNRNAHKHFNLPQNGRLKARSRVRKGEEYSFSLEEVEAYLFETQVGFLVLNIQYPNEITVDQILEYNQTLSRIFNITLQYMKKYSRDESEMVSYAFSDLIRDLLSHFGISYFFDGYKRSDQEIPAQPIFFNSILINLDKDLTDKDDAKVLYCLSNGQSYNTPFYHSDNNEIGNKNNPSKWYATMGGISNLIAISASNNNEYPYYYNNYMHSVQSYFYAYILALHQRCAMLHYINRGTQLSYKTKAENVNDEVVIAKERSNVIQLNEEFITFKLRGCFNQISSKQDISYVYDLAYKSLKIDELVKEVQEDLKTLAAMIENHEAREREERIDKENKVKDEQERFRNFFQTFIIILSTFFVLISTSTDGWQLVESLKNPTFPFDAIDSDQFGWSDLWVTIISLLHSPSIFVKISTGLFLFLFISLWLAVPSFAIWLAVKFFKLKNRIKNIENGLEQTRVQ